MHFEVKPLFATSFACVRGQVRGFEEAVVRPQAYTSCARKISSFFDRSMETFATLQIPMQNLFPSVHEKSKQCWGNLFCF
jgi:hypothetical protein